MLLDIDHDAATAVLLTRHQGMGGIIAASGVRATAAEAASSKTLETTRSTLACIFPIGCFLGIFSLKIFAII